MSSTKIAVIAFVITSAILLMDSEAQGLRNAFHPADMYADSMLHRKNTTTDKATFRATGKDPALQKNEDYQKNKADAAETANLDSFSWGDFFLYIGLPLLIITFGAIGLVYWIQRRRLLHRRNSETSSSAAP